MAVMNPVTINAHHDVYGELLQQHYSLVPASAWDMPPELMVSWQQLQAEYANLPKDEFLPGKGAYRFRRYDSFRFIPDMGTLELLPHKTYFQGTDINHVTGGIVREFAPLTPTIANNRFLHELIRYDYAQFPITEPRPSDEWRVDVHLIRVIAQAGKVSQPTPEGVHRDGAEFVTVHLAELDNVSGGEVSIYDDNKQHITSFTLQNVLNSYLFRDEVLWHGVTPIRPTIGAEGVRSILTFDYHVVG